MEREPDKIVASVFDPLQNAKPKKGLISSLFRRPDEFPKYPAGAAGAKKTHRKRKASDEGVTRRFPIGLDIGSSAIKFLQLGLVGGRVHIIRLGRHELGAQAAMSEKDRMQVLQGKLKQVAGQYGLSGAAVLSVPMEWVTLRQLKLPHLPKKELEEAIRWQVEQTLNPQVRYEDLSLDYIPLEGIFPPGTPAVVLAASLARQQVTTMVELAKQAGLDPLAVEVDAFAIGAALVQTGKITPLETVLILELGARKSSLLVVWKGQPVFSRAVSISGEKLTQVISDHLRVSRDEAERYKRKFGLLADSDDARAISRSISSPMENLLIDIAHTFKSFSYQTKQAQIKNFDKVFLSGGTSLVPQLTGFLAERLHVPVEIVELANDFPRHPSLTGVEPAASGPELTLAAGLALREVSTP